MSNWIVASAVVAGLPAVVSATLTLFKFYRSRAQVVEIKFTRADGTQVHVTADRVNSADHLLAMLAALDEEKQTPKVADGGNSPDPTSGGGDS